MCGMLSKVPIPSAYYYSFVGDTDKEIDVPRGKEEAIGTWPLSKSSSGELVD